MNRQRRCRFLARTGLIAIVGSLVVPMLSSSILRADDATLPISRKGGVEVFQSKAVTPGVFDNDLRDLPTVAPWQPGDPVREVPRRSHTGRTIEPAGGDEGGAQPESETPQQDRRPGSQGGNARQFTTPQAFSPPDLDFAGIAFTGAFPPDTVGEVGPDHYIQMVNDGLGGSSFAVFDKSGNLLAGPTSLESLWTAGGACALGRGDPIVLYDRDADRWLMSEIASSGNHLCVYISITPDPIVGGWYFYDFVTPDFPDYPKYAVWPDAYYVSTNESVPSAYALDRNAMLAGNPATFQRFAAPALAGFPFQALIPSDLDGATPPPAGAPNYFMRHRDDEVHNIGSAPTQDFLEIWEFRVDWVAPANSSFTVLAQSSNVPFVQCRNVPFWPS